MDLLDYLPHPVLSWAQFVLSFPVAWLISVWLHELGHVAAGRLAGVWVWGCGLGYGRPYGRWKVGGTVYFIAQRWWSLGQTLWGSNGTYPSPRGMILFSLGGPTASLATAAATIAAWRVAPSDFVAALFYASLWGTRNLVPFSIPLRNGTVLLSDGMIALRTWQGRLQEICPTPQMLVNLAAFRGLAAELECPEAEANYALSEVAILMSLGAVKQAAELLASPVLSREGKLPRLVKWDALMRAWLASARDADNARPLFEQARDLCAQGTMEEVVLLQLMAEHEKEPTARQTYLDEAKRAGKCVGWRYVALSTAARAAMSARPLEVSAMLRGNDAKGLGDIDRLGIVVDLSQTLGRAGHFLEAAEHFREASAVMARVAAGLRDEEIRRAFLAKFSAPLREVVLNAADPSDPPWVEWQNLVDNSRKETRRRWRQVLTIMAPMNIVALLLIQVVKFQWTDRAINEVLTGIIGSVIPLGFLGLYLFLFATETGAIRKRRVAGIWILAALLVAQGAVSTVTFRRKPWRIVSAPETNLEWNEQLQERAPLLPDGAPSSQDASGERSH